MDDITQHLFMPLFSLLVGYKLENFLFPQQFRTFFFIVKFLKCARNSGVNQAAGQHHTVCVPLISAVCNLQFPSSLRRSPERRTLPPSCWVSCLLEGVLGNYSGMT